jgi:hypothetical protein
VAGALPVLAGGPAAGEPVPGPPRASYEQSCVVRFTSVAADPDRPGNVALAGRVDPCPAADSKDGFTLVTYRNEYRPPQRHFTWRYHGTARFGGSLALPPAGYRICVATGLATRSDCVAVVVPAGPRAVEVLGPFPTDDIRVLGPLPDLAPLVGPDGPGCSNCWTEPSVG